MVEGGVNVTVLLGYALKPPKKKTTTDLIKYVTRPMAAR